MRRYAIEFGGHRIVLTPGLWRVGREAPCEIRLADETVSRRHATIRVAPDGVTVRDDGSANGVRVNGDRIAGTVNLAAGDRIQVGASELRVVEDAGGRADDTVKFGAHTRPMAKPPARGTEGGLALLSERERVVFERLAHGETQRAVAEKLGVSVKTVESYRARIAEKLGLRTRADLVRFALEAGVLKAG